MSGSIRPNLDLMALIKENYDLDKQDELRTFNSNPKTAICCIDHVKKCDDNENHDDSSQSGCSDELKKSSSAQKSKKSS